MKAQSRRYRYDQQGTPRPPNFPWFCPFAPNERSQIRTYVTRETYRQGVFRPSI